jgi:hypothetical protein
LVLLAFIHVTFSVSRWRARVLAEGRRSGELARITIDDQLTALAGLGTKAIAFLTGYSCGGSIDTLRWRRKLVPSHRLQFAGQQLEAMAIAVREMARATPVRRRVTKIRPELYADLGLIFLIAHDTHPELS